MNDDFMAIPPHGTQVVDAEAAYILMDVCLSSGHLRASNTDVAHGQDPRLVTAMAAGARQIAGASRSHVHSLFLQHLFAGSGGRADANQDAPITLYELTSYLTRNAVRNTRLDNRAPVPSVQTNLPVDGHEHVMVRLRR